MIRCLKPGSLADVVMELGRKVLRDLEEVRVMLQQHNRRLSGSKSRSSLASACAILGQLTDSVGLGHACVS